MPKRNSKMTNSTKKLDSSAPHSFQETFWWNFCAVLVLQGIRDVCNCKNGGHQTLKNQTSQQQKIQVVLYKNNLTRRYLITLAAQGDASCLQTSGTSPNHPNQSWVGLGVISGTGTWPNQPKPIKFYELHFILIHHTSSLITHMHTIKWKCSV